MVASRRLYFLLALGVLPFLVSFFWAPAASAGFAYDLVLLLAVALDACLTQRPRFVTGARDVHERLSIGRSNQVLINIYNQGKAALSCRLRDDFPKSMEADVSEFRFDIRAGAMASLAYSLTPRQRGSYDFGNINLRYSSRLGLLWISRTVKAPMAVRVFSDLKA
ncbi:MAG TPA: hypothetical protein V6D08_06130, partial [Candidatus Obscuribacterales bacterium]